MGKTKSMNRKGRILYTFSDLDCIGRDENGCTGTGFFMYRRYDGWIKLTNTPKHCWYSPLEVFRWYWFGKWAVSHIKLYRKMWGIKKFFAPIFLN